MTSTTHRFGDRYVVLARAGSGGMAEVYRARDELLGREVALKVLSRRLSTDNTFVERFRREAQSAANLNHPNVVSLFDYGSDGGTYYIVMEYIDGKPLADIIRIEGALMPERAAEIAADVARALERAHSGGLVHRDIKPSNIMINSSGQTKVTDFGIARAMVSDGEQTMTQTGMVIGTAAYLSPEQAQGHPVDPRSDVYSLGVVLYESLTGRAPFVGDTPLSVAYKHVREDPQPPSSINSDVPSDLDAVVLKALAKNPENRYQSATEFREDLERFLSGQSVLATPLMGAGTGTRVLEEQEEEAPLEEERKRWPAVLLILLALAVLAVLAFLLFDPFGGQTVQVPDLSGLTRDEAEAALEEEGLRADFVDRPSGNVDENTVIETDPPAGDEVEEGGVVTVFISEGPRQTTVPDVTGGTVQEARRALREADLRLGERTQVPSSEVPEGEIISQSPEAGDEVEIDTRVDVEVSSGPELVFLPDVVGLEEDTAIANLEAAGFDVSTEEGESSDVDEGRVFDQEPDGGVEVDPTEVSEVTIFVSTGPPTTEVPDVTGEPREQAIGTLQDAGFEVQEQEEDCGQSPNTVCDTDPSPGNEAEEGSTVTIFVQPPPADEGGGEGGD